MSSKRLVKQKELELKGEIQKLEAQIVLLNEDNES